MLNIDVDMNHDDWEIDRIIRSNTVYDNMSGGIMTDSIINNVVGGRSSSNEPRMVALYPQGQYNVRQASVSQC